MDLLKRLTLLLSSTALCLLTNATSITFKCQQGIINSAADSITYTHEAEDTDFPEDFTLYQVNTKGTKEQFIKTAGKIGWRLSPNQAIHLYGSADVKAILSIDILCEDDEYIDSLLTVSAGELSMIGTDVMRITIDQDANISELKLSRDTQAPSGWTQWRPKEITISYLKQDEDYIAPIPLQPLFEPVAETYYRPWDVILRTDEPNGIIHYTTDGSTPTASSPIYSTPLYIDTHTMVKAVTCTDASVSPVDSAMYYIKVLPDTLKANTEYLIDFPNFGRTAQETPAFVEIYMPKNYETTKEYPLFVWFGPGNGGYSTSRVQAIFEKQDVICVGLPYRTWDDNGGWMTPWAYHKEMLDSIESLIHNIDPRRRMAGGWSSGGAMTMQHIGNSDDEFQEYFYGFLPGGAGFDLGRLETIKGQPMFITIGSEDDRRYSLGELAYEAELAGVDVTYNEMEGIGHDLPTSEYPNIREWIYQKIINRDSVQTNVLLESISVDGVALASFEATTYGYEINLRSSTIPKIEAKLQNADNTLTIDEASEDRDWCTYIYVKAADGTEQRYTVYFHILSSNAYPNCIQLDGELMDSYVDTITEYEVVVDNDEIPSVYSWGRSAEAHVTIVQATQIPGTATIIIMAEDSSTTMIYNINFVKTASALSSLKGNKCKVYPNPGKHIICIEGNSICEVTIFGMDGKIVNRHSGINANTTNIPISDLRRGTYIIQMYDQDGVSRTILMKE